jgi:hypothetical protein
MRLPEKQLSPRLLRRDKRKLQELASRALIFQLQSKSRRVVRRPKIKRTQAMTVERVLFELLDS